MPKICYQPDDRIIQAEPEKTILEASLAAGIPMTHACGGQARCSTCRVMVLDGLETCAPRNEAETVLAGRLRFTPQMRLACQTRITSNLTVRRLVLDPEDEELASQDARIGTSAHGVEKQIAVMFADIAGFTAFSESLPPYDVIHSLNRYYQQIGTAIARHGGTINNYAGDGCMALFGLDDAPNATLRAVRAGFEMLQVIERLRPYFAQFYGRCIGIRIGLHYGDVVVGTVGYGEQAQTTVIGDTVNFASRIEAANKRTKTHFLLSHSAFAEVQNHITAREIPNLRIRGKRGKHALYEAVSQIG